MSSTRDDQRQRKRYLCDEHFEVCLYHAADRDFEVTAIDFNRDGIGIFTSASLPDAEDLSISIVYQSDLYDFQLAELACKLIHANFTEVGNQYGLRFSLESIEEEIQQALQTIEQLLGKPDNLSERYPLLNDL